MGHQLTIAGTYAYNGPYGSSRWISMILCNRALFRSRRTGPAKSSVTVIFRYAFVDEEAWFDITFPDRAVLSSATHRRDAWSCVSRTMRNIAEKGPVIVDVGALKHLCSISLRCGWADQRCPQRESGLHQRQSLYLHSRWAQWPAGATTHLAGTHPVV